MGGQLPRMGYKKFPIHLKYIQIDPFFVHSSTWMDPSTIMESAILQVTTINLQLGHHADMHSWNRSLTSLDIPKWLCQSIPGLLNLETICGVHMGPYYDHVVALNIPKRFESEHHTFLVVQHWHLRVVLWHWLAKHSCKLATRNQLYLVNKIIPGCTYQVMQKIVE